MSENAKLQVSASGDDYARQWIDFLRKRNTLLNVLWPIFLILSICLGVAAFYFQQSGLSDRVDAKMLQIDLREAKDKIEILNAELALKSGKLETIQAELDELDKQVKSKGDISKALTEKDVLNAQIISKLESQIALLETEKESLNEALEENMALVALHKGSLEKKNTAKDQLLREQAELTSKLESRKVAYSALAKRLKAMQIEMDRLVSENIKLEKLLVDSKKHVSQLEGEAENYMENQIQLNKAISSLENEKASLRKKLNSILSPISSSKPNQKNVDNKTNTVQKSAASSNDSISKTEKNSVSTVLKEQPNSLVFEEIKAPVKPIASPQTNKKEDEKSKPAKSEFDFDKISIH